MPLKKQISRQTIILLILTLICIGLGFGLFFTGCDPKLQSCTFFYAADGRNGNYSISSTTFSQCVVFSQSCSEHCTTSNGHKSCSTSCHTVCTAYRYYTCYTSYAHISFVLHGSDHSCSPVIADYEDESLSNAVAIVKSRYPYGAYSQVYVQKNDLSCVTPGAAASRTIAGIAMLALGSIACCGWLWSTCGTKQTLGRGAAALTMHDSLFDNKDRDRDRRGRDEEIGDGAHVYNPMILGAE